MDVLTAPQSTAAVKSSQTQQQLGVHWAVLRQIILMHMAEMAPSDTSVSILFTPMTFFKFPIFVLFAEGMFLSLLNI